MSRICTSCNKEIPEDVKFCTECGAKLPEEQTEQAVEAVSAAEPVAPVAVAEPVAPVAVTEPLPNAEQNASAAPETVPKGGKYGVVGTGAFFGLQALFSIPIIGYISSIIFSFAPKNKNLKSFSRATLIWQTIGIVLLIIAYLLINMLINAIASWVNATFGGVLGSAIIGGIDDIGQYAGVIEMFESGEMDDIMGMIESGDFDSLKEQFSGEEFESIISGFENGEYDALVEVFESGDVEKILEEITSGEYDELLESIEGIDFSQISAE